MFAALPEERLELPSALREELAGRTRRAPDLQGYLLDARAIYVEEEGGLSFGMFLAESPDPALDAICQRVAGRARVCQSAFNRDP